jgi:CBS domain-containing protein
VKVKDLMQAEVVTLRVTDTLEAADTFMRAGLIRHLPVIDADNYLVGLIAQADVVKASASSVRLHAPGKDELGMILARDVMVTDIMTTAPDTEIVEAVDLLVRGRLSCLPVVENSRLVGILTETDCLRYLSDLLKARAAGAEVP